MEIFHFLVGTFNEFVKKKTKSQKSLAKNKICGIIIIGILCVIYFGVLSCAGKQCYIHKEDLNMQKKISNLPYNGTAEQEQKLRSVIDHYKSDKSQLMTVMHEAQEIYGYLPMEVQNMIAEGMDVPLEKVFGVATFYAQFSLSPKGDYNISVCLGTACYVKGSGIIFDKLSEKLGIAADECTPDGKFSLTACRCIGACGLAPVLTVNDEVYGRLTEKDVDTILAKYGK